MGSPRIVENIEIWPIEKLIPYERNARVHSVDQVDEIAGAILKFGFNNPILVDSKAGIIAGHGRLLGARKLEMENVPVIVLDHLSDQEKRAYILVDNKLGLNSSWDETLLSQEIGDLLNEDFDVSDLGFSIDELADLNIGFVYEYSSQPQESSISNAEEKSKEENQLSSKPRTDHGSTDQGHLEKSKDKKEAEGAKEYSQAQFAEFQNRCPRCGFEFNGDA